MFKATPAMVKELRDKTSAGMLDCKKAVEACEGDIEKAITWLAEKGITKAEKKADLVAAEGLTSYTTKGNEAVMFELNSQTDFVAKNDKFLALLEKVASILIDSKAQNTEEALEVNVNGKTLATVILEDSAVIGEKISLRRVTRISKKSGEEFGLYKHMGGRISVVATFTAKNDEVNKDVAMQIAAMGPKYISRNDISPAVLEEEKDIILKASIEENNNSEKPKPQNIIEKMLEGRLNKYLKEICLLDQPFVKNPDQTVAAYLQGAKTEIISFTRLEVGEGIEKEVVDFAAEVKAQAGL
ncbi:MAG: translation elongation factor Ts [Anaeroplasmataceae bacterium]